MKWWDRMPWSLLFWVLSFKPAFSLSSFTFIKKLVSSSLLSAIRVVSSAYLRLLIFLLAILIPVCASFSPAFWMMQSAYKLNKQWQCTVLMYTVPFPVWNQSVVPCPVLTVATWTACISQGAGKVVWYSHLLKNFPHFIVIYTVKSFGIVNKAEVDVFLGLSCFFSMIQRMLALWSLVLLPFLNPAWTSGSSQFTYCWSLAWRILSITLLVCEMSAIVW